MSKELKPIDKLKSIINADSVQEQIKKCMNESAGLFTASLIDIYSSDSYLQKCSASDVVKEALKAATLKLPINKGLGFAYIVPFKNKPTFLVGYKGYIQLAQRTGQYRYLNADAVYEGELIGANKLTGEIDLSGDKVSDKVIGYFAHMELLSGFRKTVYWSTERVTNHAKKYSPSFSHSSSPWKTHFEAMAIKTVIKQLLGKYGVMSVEIITAFDNDDKKPTTYEHESSVIDVNMETGEIITEKENIKEQEIDCGF